jgi:hypothetical protein
MLSFFVNRKDYSSQIFIQVSQVPNLPFLIDKVQRQHPRRHALRPRADDCQADFDASFIYLK